MAEITGRGEGELAQGAEAVKTSIFSPESWSPKDADFHAPYPVKADRQTILDPLDVVNRIFASEVASGERTAEHKPEETPDRFESFREGLNIVLTQGRGEVFLSKADIADIEERHKKYFKARRLPPETVQREQGKLSGLKKILELSIRDRWEPKPKPPMPDNFVPNWWRNRYKRGRDKLNK